MFSHTSCVGIEYNNMITLYDCYYFVEFFVRYASTKSLLKEGFTVHYVCHEEVLQLYIRPISVEIRLNVCKH